MRFVLLLAAVDLLLGVVVHASTFIGANPYFPAIVWLHFCSTFIVFAPAVIVARRMAKGASRDEFWERAIQPVPLWLRSLVGGLFIYAIANFFITASLSERATPKEVDGRYLLVSHGKVVRQLAHDEFITHRAYVARQLSGQAIFFSSVSLLFLIAWDKRKDAQRIVVDDDSDSSSGTNVTPF